jgi:ABC-type multidrug transport system ATPase subunit
MKLGVFGSRTICDSRAAMIIAETVQKLSNVTTIITTQEPRGVCEVAQRFAKEQHLILELHFLNVGKYAQGAFEHRSDEVIKSADYLVLIHDGVSHGTANELERTKKFCKPYRYEIIEPTNLTLDRDIGFNIKNDLKSSNTADNTDNFNINDFI